MCIQVSKILTTQYDIIKQMTKRITATYLAYLIFRLPLLVRLLLPATPSARRLPSEPKTLQNRRVSSAAAEHTRLPSGDVAMCSTREEWPLSSLQRTILGYFHRHS